MKKPSILIISIIISVITFFVLLQVFLGVKDYIVNQYNPEYITTSPKDSLYMELLQNPNTQTQAVQIAQTVQGFYFTTDSLKTLLDAKISPDLISEIIINKGLASQVRKQLLALDSSNIIICQNQCLDAAFLDEKKWLEAFQEKEPLEIRNFIQEKINLVVEAEKAALQKIEK